jgi:hypothetical protein
VRDQTFADLDRRRFTGAIGAEQAEAFLRPNVDIEAVNSDDVAVGFSEAVDGEGERKRSA